MSGQIDPSAELLLLEMQNDKLYGEVVVQFQGGKVTLLKRTETIKPLSRDNRDESEDRDG